MVEILDTFAPDVDFEAEPEAETPEVVAEPQLEVKPVEEAKPEQKEEPKPEPKPEEPKPQKMVPVENVAAVKAQAREWRQKAEKIEREANERFEKLEARLERLMNPPAPVPKFEDDPAANLQHQIAATKEELAALRQTSEQALKMQETQQFEHKVATATQAAEAAFAKDHPDYLAAVQHLQAVADRNLEMMGTEDPAARQAQIRQDALAMSLRALQMGKSPAEVAYQLAVNYGYKPAQEPEKSTTASTKIAAIQAGQKTAALPSGSSKQTALTLAALEQMDDDEFNHLVEDDASWKKLVRQMQ